MGIVVHLMDKLLKMGRFKENDLPKAKITANSLNKAKIIFKYAGKNRWKFYVGLVFLLLTSVTALAFPKFMGMLVDCVNKKDGALANQIALGLGPVLLLQSVFSFFRLSLKLMSQNPEGICAPGISIQGLDNF